MTTLVEPTPADSPQGLFYDPTANYLHFNNRNPFPNCLDLPGMSLQLAPAPTANRLGRTELGFALPITSIPSQLLYPKSIALSQVNFSISSQFLYLKSIRWGG